MIRIVPVRRQSLASLLAFGLALVSILPSVPAQAQCYLTQAPYQFAPPQLFPRMGLRANVNSINLALDRPVPRLSIKYNYGFMIWDIPNGTPVPGAWLLKDLRDAPEMYPVSGDSGGRSGETVLSSDGARALTGWADPGFGVVAMTQTPSGYSGGGDYDPGGAANAVVKLDGSRYLAFSVNSVGSIYVADVTSLQTSVPARPANGIPSELAHRMAENWAIRRVKAIEGGSQKFVGVSTVRGVAIGELRTPGSAVPNLSTNFLWRQFSAAALGLPADKKLSWADFALHPNPTDGGIYILAQSYTVTAVAGADYAVAVSLSRMDPTTGALVVQAVYTPEPSTYGWPQGALVASASDVLSFFLLNPPGSTASQLNVRSGSDFSLNLAQSISWSVPKIDDFRVQKYGPGEYALYLANTDHIEAAQVTCSACATPAAPVLSAPTTSITGGQSLLVSWTVPTNLPSGGTYILETSRQGNFGALEASLQIASNSAVLTTRQQDTVYDLFVRVRAVSPCGSIGPNSAALHVAVGVAPTTFAFTRSSATWTVAAGDAPPSASVDVRNVGATAGAISFAPNGAFFDVAPASLTLGPGVTGSVTVTVRPTATRTAGVSKGFLLGTWGNQTLSTPVTLMVTDKPVPPNSRAGSKVKASATTVLFLAPEGKTPAPQTLTLRVPSIVGSAPLYLAPSIGPGGSWLLLSSELSQPLPASGQVTLSLSVDRTRRATTDGDAPLRTLLTIAPVGGSADDATIIEVVDQETWHVESGAGGRGGQVGFGNPAGVLQAAATVSGFLIPATVKASGANGATFYSDGWLRNLGATEAPLQLYFTPRNQDGLTGAGVLKADSCIGPGKTLRLSDLLGSVFQATGSGQVELRSPAAAGLTLRTTVEAVTGGDPALSFGTEIPTSASGTGLGASDTAILVLPGISDDATNRSNLILAETSGSSATARVDLTSATGESLGSTTASIPPYGQVQIDRVVQAIAPGRNVTGGWLGVTALSGAGRLSAVATVLDNRSNSFSAVSGNPVSLQTPAQRGQSADLATAPLVYVIPTLVRASGLNNTLYVTTLSLVNGRKEPANLTLTYHYTDLTDGSSKVTTKDLRLEGRQALDPALASDVLANVLGVTAPSRGWLEVKGDVSSVTAVATISTQVDPKNPAKGVNSAQVSGFYTPSAALLQLGTQEKRFAGMEKSVLRRTNFILAETAGQSATVRLRAYSLTGQQLAEKTVSVPPLAYFQINDIFGAEGLALGEGPYQNVEIAAQIVEGGGQVVGVVTLVGNLSKNPQIFLLKDPGPPPVIGF